MTGVKTVALLGAASVFGAAAMAGSAGGEVASTGSTLQRPDAPVVLQQTSADETGAATGPINVTLPGRLHGIAPADLVAFRWDGSWQQIPVQVDEKEVMDLNRIYGPGYPTCGDPCYSKPRNGAVHRNYTDAGTWVGPDTDATLDGDDEVAFMARDAGGKVASGFAPGGVNPASAVEVALSDTLYGGEGYVYLFEDASGLDPAAGADYVDYDFVLESGKGYLDEDSAYDPDGDATRPNMRFGPRPEDSRVTTANYTRGFDDRWLDDHIQVHRGGATGVDILDRHDAQFDSLDASCVRTQATYRSGEGAFVINRDGPVRAIRDFIGANSGPHVQRQHIFYSGKEDINTFLRVHAVPGVVDFFDYSAAGNGLTYRAGMENGLEIPAATIDGFPDAVPPLGGASGIDGWESVDGPQGGLSMAQIFRTNNADPTYHLTYRDGLTLGKTCNGDGELYGASGPQVNTVIENTDEAAGNFKNLYYRRSIYFEAPGETDGAKRLAEEQEPIVATPAPIELAAEPDPNAAPAASFTVSPATPGVGQAVTFASTSTDSDGTVESFAWDLDGDGAFDDATGATATRSFPAAGTYVVGLRVTDDDGATAETTRAVTVCKKKRC